MKLLGKRQFRMDFWTWVKIIVILALCLFIVYPFYTILTKSVFSTKVEGITLYNFTRFFTKPYYYKSLLRSLYVCFFTVLASTAIGVPIAYLMTRYNILGKKAMHIMTILSLMSPPFIGAYSWIILLGRNGLAAKLFTMLGLTAPTIYGRGGIIFVFTLHLFPYIYLYTSGAMNSIDSSLEEAAENLGMSKLRRIWTVTLPVILPSILAGCLMVFMTCLADFGTPMLLGEGYVVLPVLVYNEYMSESATDPFMASALSVVIVICSLLVLVFQKYVIDKRNYQMSSLRPPVEVQLHGGKRLLASLPIYIVIFLASLPQIVVICQSFVERSFSGMVKGINLSNYQTILKRLFTNIKNTYVFSSVAIVFIVLVGIFVAYILVRKKGKVASLIDMLIMFPYVIPGSVLGIGLIIAFNRKPIILVGTSAIMIISYVVRKLPYTVRSGTAFLCQMDPFVEEASINLGVPPLKTFFTVTARMMLPGVMSGAVLSWITCINELSSSIMLYTGKTSTISVAIYQEVVRMSDGTAAALSTILTLTTIISLLIVFRVTKGKVKIV
ncbi:MAG: iron ABC transporter permease [Sphaerochaetaceae bacterium]|jgi:iron(III) transport system permease protein|nr:iron ABC transporter permease [Sphaerochaetaceae bacterium]